MSYASMWLAVNTCNSCDYIAEELHEKTGYCKECQAQVEQQQQKEKQND